MVTYLYWFVLSATAISVLMGLGVRFGLWKFGFGLGAVIMLVGTLAYYFYFEQMFVKRYGGIMTISAAEGTVHLGSTWKDDHLWVEAWDPRSNECIFSEYARSGLLEGSVVIKDCNPLQSRVAPATALPPATP